MWKNSKLVEAERLEKKFLEICNSNVRGDEYYSLIVDMGTYDGLSWTTKTVDMKVPRAYMHYYYNWSISETHKETDIDDANIGIYAFRDKTGFYEMITGKKVTTYSYNNSYNDQIYCYGLERENDLEKIGRDLKFLDANPQFKDQYINSLLSISNNVYTTRRTLDEEEKKGEREKESTIQYVKSYKIPNKKY